VSRHLFLWFLDPSEVLTVTRIVFLSIPRTCYLSLWGSGSEGALHIPIFVHVSPPLSTVMVSLISWGAPIFWRSCFVPMVFSCRLFCLFLPSLSPPASGRPSDTPRPYTPSFKPGWCFFTRWQILFLAFSSLSLFSLFLTPPLLQPCAAGRPELPFWIRFTFFFLPLLKSMFWPCPPHHPGFLTLLALDPPAWISLFPFCIEAPRFEPFQRSSWNLHTLRSLTPPPPFPRFFFGVWSQTLFLFLLFWNPWVTFTEGACLCSYVFYPFQPPPPVVRILRNIACTLCFPRRGFAYSPPLAFLSSSWWATTFSCAVILPPRPTPVSFFFTSPVPPVPRVPTQFLRPYIVFRRNLLPSSRFHCGAPLFSS